MVKKLLVLLGALFALLAWSLVPTAYGGVGGTLERLEPELASMDDNGGRGNGEDDDGDDDRGDDDDDDGGGPPTLVEFTAGEGTAYYGVGVPATFNFDVERGPTGPAIGGGTFTSAFGIVFFGNATCLEVEGNLAIFEIDNVNPDNPDQDLQVEVADFGTPGENPEGGDEINFRVISGADGVCPAPIRTDDPLIVGDVVVGERPLGGGDGDGDDDDDDDDDDGDEDGDDDDD